MCSNPRSRWCVWTGAVRIQGIDPEDIEPTPEHWGRYLVRRPDGGVRDQGRRVHGCAGRGRRVPMRPLPVLAGKGATNRGPVTAGGGAGRRAPKALP